MNKINKFLLQLSLELSDALILVNKVNLSSWRRQPQKQSLEPPTTGKKPTQHCLSPMFVLIKSRIGQALLPTKNWCKLCSMTCRMQCSKWKIFLYLLIATVSLISIQNHGQISSCINFRPNIKVLVSY